MATLREWMRRLWGTLRPDRDRELQEELKLHLELASEDEKRRGESPEDARRAARLQAGGVAQAVEALRDQRGLPRLDDLSRDMRYALRQLTRNPGFAATVVLILAVAIGASTAIFSVFDALVLRPLPYRDPEQLVRITESFRRFDITGMQLAPVELDDLRAMTRSFSYIAGIRPGEFALTGMGAAEGRFGPSDFSERFSHAGCAAYPG